MGVTQRLGGKTVLDQISFTVNQGETWAITGNSGSGKSALARSLAGQQFVQGRISYNLPDSFGEHPGIAFIEQQHQFRTLSNTDSFYYQQRYNSFDSEDSLTVAQYLGNAGPDTVRDSLARQWGLADMLDKPLIQLSNGENKRLQLAVALASGPAVMILDSPFTGLDADGRQTLDQLIATIGATGVLVIIVGRFSELPQAVSHLLVLDQGAVVYRGTRTGYEAPPVQSRVVFDQAWAVPVDHDLPDQLVLMEDVTVKYGSRDILQGINWEVRKGQQWSVSGPNGAGKSTLLSLITGDNPQAYANRIWLFGRRRGTGETIWEIKQRIGYVSPELHLSFERSDTAFDVVASGLFDTIGLFRQLSDSQRAATDAILTAMGMAGTSTKRLFQLSLGQQRLILLARALVKRPPLLILDEPCQGLDDEQSLVIKNMIGTFCTATNTTLIYISHYVADIPSGVDHHLRLENGKLVATGR
ncbi:MAG: ATP-binding cassette domain-containing protein [Chitinophagaceae bacterium]|nr:MAG: ATP-binding cassette domain-containing protein [Chitinophagaceae bacterium]